MSESISQRFTRQYLSAKFQENDKLCIGKIGLSGPTAADWLRMSARGRTMVAFYNLAWLLLGVYGAIGFFEVSLRLKSNIAITLRVLAILSFLTAWFTLMTLIWMYRNYHDHHRKK